ncbi:MAG: cobyrinic acid a,c-diamide synthase [marine bacterium B5-7]|nr:MAG: cobyrinic acid a,c-diamide synthase [marine bacterium B5-7]
MRIVALYSIKGGVGKTAASVNLAWQSANVGYRTLLWDLDPQGATSYYFRIQPHLKGGVKTVLKKKLTEGIKATDYPGLDLLPADFTYRNLDLILDQQKKRKRTLEKVIERFTEDYDRIILDCAPSISLVSENIFRSADMLLNPLIPSTLSIRTLDQLSAFLKASKLNDVRLLNFFSMVDRRRKLHRELMTALSRQRVDILESAIPNSSVVERMGIERRPVSSYAARSTPAVAYKDLWREIDQRL